MWTQNHGNEFPKSSCLSPAATEFFQRISLTPLWVFSVLNSARRNTYWGEWIDMFFLLTEKFFHEMVSFFFYFNHEMH